MVTTDKHKPSQGLAVLKDFRIDQNSSTIQTSVDNTCITNTNNNQSHNSLTESRTSKIDYCGRAYGTGKRKTSIARVWIKPGCGIITVNNYLVKEYLASAIREMIVSQPLEVTHTNKKFDVICTVKGGGLSGQAGAIRHGIARALQAYDPSWRQILKPFGLLTRDARRVERKKYGRAKARRSFQFSKR